MNTNANEVKETAWSAVKAAGLSCNDEGRQRVSKMVQSKGNEVLYALSRSIDTDSLLNDLAEWEVENPVSSTIRVLGYGYLLTEYSTSFLLYEPGTMQAVCELGAISNMIVSAFDTAVDAGEYADSALPLEVALNGVYEGIDEPRNGPNGPLAELVRLYYSQMGALAARNNTGDRLKTIYKLIEKMYESELATLNSEGHSVATKYLARKAALPFIVSGATAWLANPEISDSLANDHLKWLYRFGLFFGLVDDAVDFVIDEKTGNPNLLRLENQSGHSPASISKLGLRVISDRVLLGQKIGRESGSDDVMRACVASWFT